MTDADVFLCPITLEPVLNGELAITSAGQAYSAAALQRWFDEGHTTDPLTGAQLSSKHVVRFKYTKAEDAAPLAALLASVRDRLCNPQATDRKFYYDAYAHTGSLFHPVTRQWCKILLL